AMILRGATASVKTRFVAAWAGEVVSTRSARRRIANGATKISRTRVAVRRRWYPRPMSAGICKIKGSMILGRLGFIEEGYRPRWNEYFAALEPDTRKAIEQGILKSSWYPFAMFLDVSRVAEQLFGQGDYSVVRKMAAHSARVNMPSLYKIFLRIG